MHKFKGFILIAVLIVMQIFVLLGWYMLKNSLLQLRAQYLTFHKYQIYAISEDVLKQIERLTLQQVPKCMIEVTNLSELKLRNSAWWRSSVVCQAAQGSFYFHYILENLGQDPCSMIKKPGTIANYYRITLKANDALDESAIYLQSVVAKPILSVDVCLEDVKSILSGRQSWIEG